MDGFTIKHDDELERDYGKWVLVRRSLGVGSFGINAVELPPGESIPEHDETARDQEELFMVLSGRATFLIDAKGRIARAWRKVKVPGHAEEVLEAVQAMSAT